jgi:hypothetical protein
MIKVVFEKKGSVHLLFYEMYQNLIISISYPAPSHSIYFLKIDIQIQIKNEFEKGDILLNYNNHLTKKLIFLDKEVNYINWNQLIFPTFFHFFLDIENVSIKILFYFWVEFVTITTFPLN